MIQIKQFRKFLPFTWMPLKLLREPISVPSEPDKVKPQLRIVYGNLTLH